MRKLITSLIFLLASSISIFAQKAPDFKVKTTDNEDIGLYPSFLDKGKSVVIELFFVDCPPCRSFAPFMADLHKDMEERDVQVEFISLSIVDWDTDETVNGFKSEFNHDWHFAHFEGGSEAASEPYRDGTFGPYFGTPAIAVISPDGTVNYIKRLFNNEEYIEAIETAIVDSQTTFNENNEPVTAIVSGGINTLKGEGVGAVTVNLTGAKDTTIITDANGRFQTGSLLADESYTISLEKNDDHSNGVTTFDIIYISKHILGIDTFTTSQEHIAADVNKSGSATAFDLVQIRRLILGIIDEFPNSDSWAFEPATITLASLADLSALSFTAIKIGDLNNSAKTNSLVSGTDRERPSELTLFIEDRQIKAGEQVSVSLNSRELAKIQGFQFTMEYNSNVLKMNDLEIGELPNYTTANFNLLNKEKGLISTSWDTRSEQNSTSLFTLNFTAKQRGKLSDLIQLNSALTSMVAYDWNSEELEVKLAFTNTEVTNFTEVSLFPNPSATNTVFLEILTDKRKEVTLTISDIAGQILISAAYSLNIGTQLIPINTADFPSGVYTVQLSDGTAAFNTMRLVKQ